MLRWTLPLAAALLAGPAGAFTVNFGFEGRCTQLCDGVGLEPNGLVTGMLAVDDAWLPPTEGLVAYVPNSELLALDIEYGTLRFGLADVVGTTRTLFTRRGERWFVVNGDEVLASRNGFDMLIGARDGAVPSVWLSIYQGNSAGAAAAGVFATPVPEPATAAMALAGLALVGACASRRRSL